MSLIRLRAPCAQSDAGSPGDVAARVEKLAKDIEKISAGSLVIS